MVPCMGNLQSGSKDLESRIMTVISLGLGIDRGQSPDDNGWLGGEGIGNGDTIRKIQ